MSIPRRDPEFTMADLQKVGERLMDAAYEYWEASHKAGIGGAVIWITDMDGKMVMLTRGEYRRRLLQNIDDLGIGVHEFGRAGDES